MKKVFLLLLLAAVLLCGCAAENSVPQEPYTQVIEDVELLIDPQNQTITYGDDVYHYKFGENETRITYPNGAVFWERYISDGVSSMGWSDDDTDMMINNGAPYLDGYLLVSVIPDSPVQKTEENEDSVLLLLIGLGLLALGILEIALPQTVWYGKHGWMYKDAEPSDTALGLIRALGVLTIAIGVISVVLYFVL